MFLPKLIENAWMLTYGGPRDTDKRPSRRGWREQMRWGRRCVRTSLSLRCGCATARAATLRSGSPRNSRRSWCSPSRPDTRSRTPRRAPACEWRCSSEWLWPSEGGCLLWGSAFSGKKKRKRSQLQERLSSRPHCVANAQLVLGLLSLFY